MDTVTRTLSLLGVAALLVLQSGSTVSHPAAAWDDDDGNASAGLTITPPNDAVQAAFTKRSYRPGTTATLRLRGRAPQLSVQLFRAGLGQSGPLDGAPVGPDRTIHPTESDLAVTIGNWPSGFYYAQVTTPGKGTWYAPFVLRPQHLGEHRVAVVLPTNTWQAYNYEDDDSWYANADVHTIDLTRPFVAAGVPPHYTGYDRGFIRWLVLNHHATDFFADDDLDATSSGAALAHAYDLIVFSGHEEYVTEHEFDVTQQYRDLGGNLAFLAANNFFYKVVKHGDSMDGRWRWRDLGRPEASLVGVQYVDWNHAEYPNRPYVADRATWLFRGTGLSAGTSFGKYGIEVDATNSDSPPGTHVLAQINGIFGAGVNAQMAYYTTPRGAKVFAAGVMNFGGSTLWPHVTTMMANIWSELARP